MRVYYKLYHSQHSLHELSLVFKTVTRDLPLMSKGYSPQAKASHPNICILQTMVLDNTIIPKGPLSS